MSDLICCTAIGIGDETNCARGGQRLVNDRQTFGGWMVAAASSPVIGPFSDR